MLGLKKNIVEVLLSVISLIVFFVHPGGVQVHQMLNAWQKFLPSTLSMTFALL